MAVTLAIERQLPDRPSSCPLDIHLLASIHIEVDDVQAFSNLSHTLKLNGLRLIVEIQLLNEWCEGIADLKQLELDLDRFVVALDTIF